MINMFEVNETNKMITQENLDVRTITLGISLLDCVDADMEVLNENIYRKITTVAADRKRVWYPDRQQTNLHHTDRFGWRQGM